LVAVAQRTYIADALYTYAVRLAAATRHQPDIRVGVSPRGVIALTRAAQVYSLASGRGYVVPEDLQALVLPVFAHRVLLAPDAQMRGRTAVEVLQGVVESIPAPMPVPA
jgi:MoxR-like ATPase